MTHTARGAGFCLLEWGEEATIFFTWFLVALCDTAVRKRKQKRQRYVCALDCPI